MRNAPAIEPFTPSAVGHLEEKWLQTLLHAKTWKPASGPLLIVSPHPDDEILGAGGLIHEWAESGHAVTILSVTDGEAAYPDWPSLGNLRIRELHRALRRLSGTHIPVFRLALPDGQVHQSRNRLRNALSSAITAQTTLVAPYEKDGHPDHNAVGEVCLEVARITGTPCIRYPIWRWHHGSATELDTAQWVKVSLPQEARRAKAHAIRCFSSQLAPTNHDPILPSHVLQYFEREFEAFML